MTLAIASEPLASHKKRPVRTVRPVSSDAELCLTCTRFFWRDNDGVICLTDGDSTVERRAKGLGEKCMYFK